MTTTLLHLSLIEGIGPVTIDRVLNVLLQDRSRDIYSYCVSDFVQICGLSTSNAQKVVRGLKDKKIIDEELELIARHAIQLYTILDPKYPQLLKHIYAAPPVLYVKGFLDSSAKSLAVVGSRLAHAYARRTLEFLLPPLIQNNWTIVSGGASGADTFAHEITLKNEGITHVVLGSGLLHLYPTHNKKLFNLILEKGGALISHFALNQPPIPGNFPARNRVIAGLSKGCLVAQAAQKSGARITADFALEQGKDVFVVPGAIDDPLSAGGHALIQEGAKLITCAEDILIEYNEVQALPAQNVHHQENSHQQKSSSMNQQIVTTEFQDPLVTLCKKPLSIEELASLSNLSLLDLQIKLFDLQIEGKIKQNFAGLWASELS